MAYVLIPLMPGSVPSSQSAAAQAITSYTEDYSSITNIENYVINRGQGNPATTDFLQPTIDPAALNKWMQTIRSGGTGNVVSKISIVPAALVNPSVKGLAQFAQAKLISQSATAGVDTGPAVLIQGDLILDEGINPNGGNGYFLDARNSDNLLYIRRASITGTTVLATGVGFSAGDTLRLEVHMPTSTSYFVQAFKNGGSVGSVTDTNINRPLTGLGYPGMFHHNTPIPNGTFSRWGSQTWGIL